MTTAPLTARAGGLDLWAPVRLATAGVGVGIDVTLAGTTLLVDGPARSGRTNVARLVTAAGLLDPTARVLAFGPTGGHAWHPHRRTAHQWGPGPATGRLAELLGQAVEDLDRRYDQLLALDAAGLLHTAGAGRAAVRLTRPVARSLGTPPVVVVVDDAQGYMTDRRHGPAIARRLAIVALLGPAAGYTLVATIPDGWAYPAALRDAAVGHLTLHRAARPGAGTLTVPGTPGAGVDAQVDHLDDDAFDAVLRRARRAGGGAG